LNIEYIHSMISGNFLPDFAVIKATKMKLYHHLVVC